MAGLTLWRYRPGIIGVTGNVGKTSTKLAIKAVLEGERRVRASAGNLNNELGLPLAILGDWSDEETRLVSSEGPKGARFAKAFFWFRVILRALASIASPRRGVYPEILILEYGIDRPGEMKELVRIAKPNVSVMTAIGDIPVHVEFFDGPDEVLREKARLVEALGASGFAVLNADDARIMALKDRTRAHIATFGFKQGAEVRATHFSYRMGQGGRPEGVSFKLEYGGSFVPVRLDGVLGEAQAYAASAAAAVGLIFGLNLVKISEALKNYAAAAHRLEIAEGPRGSVLIDDSYNASVLSMEMALKTLRGIPAERRIALLGEMREIGKYRGEAHAKIGMLAAKCADLLFVVGDAGKLMDAAAGKETDKRKIRHFPDAKSAADALKNVLKRGDILLVKASHAVGLTAVVEALEAERKAEGV